MFLFLLLAAALAEPAMGPPHTISPAWTATHSVQTGTVATLFGAPTPGGAGGLVDNLHVLGFSPMGHVALFSEPADEAMGGYLWTFTVRDLRRDADVVTLSWADKEFEYIRTVMDVNQHHGVELMAGLAAHKVQLDPELVVEAFPWTWGGHTYDVRFEPIPATDLDYGRRAHVILTATELGEKRIGTVQWTGEGGCCGQPQAVVVKSPHEARAAVIVQAWSRGWEGPPHVLRSTVLGADLVARFKGGDGSGAGREAEEPGVGPSVAP
jgi:hypothetical protein